MKNSKNFWGKPEDRAILRWLGSRFRTLLPATFIAAFGQTIASANDVMFAFCARKVVDSAVSGVRERLVWAATETCALLAWTLTVAIFNQAIVERIRARAELELQSRTLRRLLLKDYSATLERHSGDVINRLTSDVKVVCDGVASILPALASLSTRLIFAFAALCYFDAWFACLFFAVGLVVFATARLFRRFLKKLHQAVQEAEGKKREFWQETLENLFVVKTFSRETIVDERSQVFQREHFNATMKRRNFGLVAGSGFYCVFSSGYLFALIWCAFRLLAGSMSFGTLTATLQLVGKVQSPFATLSGLVPRYFSALASAERIRELEELPDEANLDAPIFTPTELFNDLEAIVFDDVSFGYRRDGREIDVFKGASFELPKSANVVFCGRSGIGKSSLFKLLTSVCVPTSGRIYLRTRRGSERVDIPLDRRTRPLFACVPQGNLLFSGTIRDTLAFFRTDVSDAEIRTAIRTAGADFVYDVPDGLDARLGQNGQGFSEGQIQRLAIARALLTDAPILLLDESTSALDAATEHAVLERLKNDSKKTLFIISHRPAMFEVADLIAEFAENQIDLYRADTLFLPTRRRINNDNTAI